MTHPLTSAFRSETQPEFVIATTNRVIVVDPVTEAMHVLPLFHVSGIHTLHKLAG
jgi:hypothetical protein